MPSNKSPRKSAGAKSRSTAVKKSRSPARKAAANPAASRAAAPTPTVHREPVEAAVAHQETVETVLKAGTQVAAKGYEQAVALAQEQVDKASQTLFRRYDDAASFGKENVDACVLSGTVFAKGVESVGQELMSIAQSAVEANIAATKALLGAKSVRELVDLQTEFSRSRFESLLAESAKLTELGLSLAGNTAAPIQARLNATVEKLVKPQAA
ncbi:MAG TPA: phasin family protein [Kiloniellaceae bacterium]